MLIINANIAPIFGIPNWKEVTYRMKKALALVLSLMLLVAFTLGCQQQAPKAPEAPKADAPKADAPKAPEAPKK